MPNQPGLKQFRQEGCLSHFFFDPVSRELAVIDPRADLMQDYRDYISEHRLKPVIVIDTRVHWHHLSGSHFFSSEYGIPIGMAHRTESERVTRRLTHGERIAVGGFELGVYETPGVGADAICLKSGGVVFTGDTLWAQAGARLDFPGADVRALWRSQRELLGKFPDDTVFLCGYDTEELLFSMLRVEKQRNPDFKPASLDEFVAHKMEERPRGDAEAKVRIEYNLKTAPGETRESHFGSGAPGDAMGARRVASINVEKLAQKLRDKTKGVCLLDVREVSEFKEGHVPGALNLPLSELAVQLDALREYRRIYISCQTGRRSSLAAKTLEAIGFNDIVNVSGGYQAWVNAGLPTQE